MAGMKKLEAEIDRWQETTVSASVSRFPERKARFETTSHIEIKRLYTPLDQKAADYTDQLGFPGEYPFARGVRPTMHRGRLWTMRMYSGFATGEETNQRYKYLLTGADRAQCGLRFTHPDRIRFRPSAGSRRGRPGGCCHRYLGGC